MSAAALTLAADVLAALGHACTLILAIAVIGTALIILAEVFTDAGRRIDAAPIPTGTRGADRYDYPTSWATYGDECPDCGKDRCACEWRDLMAADQEHPRTVDHVTTCRACLADYEQEVTG